MARYGNPNRRSWPLLLGVAFVAVAAWAIYAWKMTTSNPTARQQVPRLAANADKTTRPDGDGSQTRQTTLRATRPAQPEETRAPASLRTELSSAVRPNDRADIRNDVEQTLGDSPADRSLEAPLQPGIHTDTLIAAGRLALSQGDMLAARIAFSRALRGDLPQSRQEELRSELQRMAEALLFSRATNLDDPLCSVHVIEFGQTINGLARRYNITENLLMAINHITEPHRIRVGQRLKIIRGPFRASISKSQHRMDILLGDTMVRTFRVGLGTNGGTPIGRWRVKNKLENPDWADPRNGRYYASEDPENPIGEYWIGLHCLEGDCLGRQGFGIHGTTEPDSIGANMSMGCVRLVPEDISDVFDLLVRGQSLVEIIP